MPRGILTDPKKQKMQLLFLMILLFFNIFAANVVKRIFVKKKYPLKIIVVNCLSSCRYCLILKTKELC